MGRLVQCHEDTGNMWQYYSKEGNPCGCGSNCFHYEKEDGRNRVLGICNACRAIIYFVKDEYTSEVLSKGKWLKK